MRRIGLTVAAVQAGEHPFDLPAVRDLDGRSFEKNVTILVGENGSGKSTILEALAVALGMNAEGGSRNFNFETRATHSELFEHLNLVRSPRRPSDTYFLRAESFYNVATQVDDLELARGYGGSLHTRSHGEAFLALVLDRFQGDGIYILDEPEAALSPQRQLALLVRMHDLARQGSQFVVATHSPIVMACPDAEVWLLDDDGIEVVDYTETDHWRVTRQFLNEPQSVLRELFADEDES